MDRTNFSYLFLLLSLLYLGVEFLNLNEIRYFTKPLLLISLSFYFYQSTKKSRNRFSLFVQCGLFFSLLGDVALLFTAVHEAYFILGLLLFLVAHICYIIAFRNFLKHTQINYTRAQIILFTLPYIVVSGIVFYTLSSRLGALFYPVLCYVSVITGMGIASAMRYNSVSKMSFSLILSGAICFMLSDTLLAFNKFYAPFNFAGISIMASYILAQYLIVEGSIAELKSEIK
ncbi:MAG: lysoplasmalogenase [Bacteroidetes bacterium]|nr:lysoplasmalogenase [Bacteroidota bacterium]